jgi:signal transduction histidine kinase
MYLTLRWRLTLLYTALLAFLLGLVAVAALLLMQRSLLGNVDSAISDSYRQFTSLVNQLGLDNPQSASQRDVDGLLPRARVLFPNDVIQIEDLVFYDRDWLIQALGPAGTAEQRRENLTYVRRLMDSRRQVVAGLLPTQPLRLSDAELTQLVESPGGRITLTREIQNAFGAQADTPTTYRVQVTLGPVQLDLSPTDPLALNAPPPSFAITYVGRSLAGVHDTVSTLQSVLALLFVTGLLMAGVGAYVLAGQALRPLRQVRQAAERIGGQTLTERVPVPQTHDEVEALAGSLNAMLDRLESSFEAQRRFTSDASHELRTPVTAISGHASYLLRRTQPTGQQRESLGIIVRESERLTNLIASLLQLARSDSGVVNLTRQPVFSGLFLGEVARELAPLASGQNTALTAAGPDIPFEGDPDRLKQVIINLVGNALKAGAQNVTMSSSAEEDGREVRLSVRDDGPGIPAEHLARLFDRFYRVEDSRSRDQGGAGLGLSIARSIVDAHGGRIWLESEVGRGTTAHVQLPVGNVPVLDDDDVP